MITSSRRGTRVRSRAARGWGRLGTPVRIIVAATASAVGVLCLATPAHADQMTELLRQPLVREALRAETQHLRHRDPVDWTALAALLTALVGIGGLLFNLWQQRVDTAAHNRQELEARKDAERRRYDEQFNGFVRDLGSAQAATRVSAAVGAIRFLDDKDTSSRFNKDVIRLLIANLKVQDDETTLEVLRQGLKLAFQLGTVSPESRNLSRAAIFNVDLHGLELDGLDLADAQAKFANFSDCDLQRLIARRANLEKATFVRSRVREGRFPDANCEGTDFSDATLVSAVFRDANLKNAKFHQARLQGALFRGAKLSGTKFSQADLTDAHFEGANLAADTFKSIKTAKNWRKAHFDESDWVRLGYSPPGS